MSQSFASMISVGMAIWPKDAGGWIGLVGGLVGLVTAGLSQWRRRLRVAVDYTQDNDADNTWHIFTITNRSDLPLTVRFVGPAWFMWTPFLPVRLDYAFNWEGYEPKLKTIAPRASETYRYVDEVWEIAPPPPQRKKPYLKFGLDVPMRGKIKWVAPRAPQNWDLSLRERWIHRLYKLYVCQ